MNTHANPVGMVKDIYKITNKVNGKIYIGQAKNTNIRFKQHCKKNGDCLIDFAIQKYGEENFTVEILEEQTSNYNEREKYWIRCLNSKVPNGYNVSDGGEEPPVLCGIKHPFASIRSEKKLRSIIYDLVYTDKSYRQIASDHCTNKKTVLGINHGFRYINPALSYPLRKNPNINGVLTPEDVKNIIEELTYSYDTNTNIGLRYGVSEHTIRDINGGKAHFNPNIDYPIRPINAARSKVNYDELCEIATLLRTSSISINKIAKKYNLDWSTVQNINLGGKMYRRREFNYPLRLPKHKNLQPPRNDYPCKEE